MSASKSRPVLYLMVFVAMVNSCSADLHAKWIRRHIEQCTADSQSEGRT